MTFLECACKLQHEEKRYTHTHKDGNYILWHLKFPKCHSADSECHILIHQIKLLFLFLQFLNNTNMNSNQEKNCQSSLKNRHYAKVLELEWRLKKCSLFTMTIIST